MGYFNTSTAYGLSKYILASVPATIKKYGTLFVISFCDLVA